MPPRKTTSKSTETPENAIQAIQMPKPSELVNGEWQHIAKFRKITVPSQDLSTYDFTNPTPRPGTAATQVSISDYEYIFVTNGVVNRAGNIRANRVMGDGIELLPSEQEGADPAEAKEARDLCTQFLDHINYKIFFKESYLNAWWGGNEWTEIIPNQFGAVVDVNHGDLQTVDFRRNFINNKIILNGNGQPAGFWQYIADLSQLYYALSSYYGEFSSYRNFQEARKRLRESQSLVIMAPPEGKGSLDYSIRAQDDLPNMIGSDLMVGLVFATTKPNYMLIKDSEMAHLSLNNTNDNPFGYSAILPAYNAINHLEMVMFATAEAINSMGYPKPDVTIGNEEHHEVTQADTNKAEQLVTNPTRRESYVHPWWIQIKYLEPGTTGQSNISQYPEWFINEAAVGLRIPKELLIGGGDSNRATAETNSSDFDKDINGDRAAMEKYISKILNQFLVSRGWKESTPGQSLYLPKIKWGALITADEALKEKMTLERWNADAITFAELRDALHLSEDKTGRGLKYKSEISQPAPQFGGNSGGNPDFGGQLGTHEGTPEIKNPAEEGKEITAKHALDPKAELNPELNRQFHTKDVDYKGVAQQSVGKLIKSVGRDRARQIRDAIVNGEAHKESADSIIKSISEIGNYNDQHSRMIFVTEHKNLMMHGDLEDAVKKGYKYKRWVAATGDKDRCEICKALDGQSIPINQEFWASKDGKQWRGKAPASHPQCRCFMAYSMEAD